MSYGRIQSLTEKELKQAFDEIVKYNDEGLLPNDALVRQIRNEFAKERGSESLDMGCTFACNEILFEIAKRHYDPKGKEYRVYYKDHANKLYDEWFDFGGSTMEEAEKVKARIEAVESTYDVEIRLV